MSKNTEAIDITKV